MKKRTNSIHVKLSENELLELKKKIKNSNKPTMQAYALDALLNSKITDQRLIDELHQINCNFSDLANTERGIGNNINQIARKVNTYDVVLQQDLESLNLEFQKNKKEREELWRQIRLYLQTQEHIMT